MFWCLPRRSLKPERSEKFGRCITSDGVNAETFPAVGNTVELRDERATDAMSLGMRSDG